MRTLLFLLLACVGLGIAGCDTMPEEDPGYDVRIETHAPTGSEIA
jgi:hypothetical protein